MLKDEIISLKEELYKEIRDVEKKLNLQIMVKSREIEEKNKKFIEEFNLMLEKNKTLVTSITTQNLYFDKINDLENFRKKIDSMIITHEIRINNNIKDIKDLSFKFGKEISDNLNVSGFIGPSCKFKSISNYLSSNINEVDRLKAEIENSKKDNKEIKKKMEEIIKTVVNLVDGSNSKCIEYTDNKNRNIEEFVNKKVGEFSDKIIEFKSLLMSQEKINEIHDNIVKKIQDNNYDKKEIDNMLNNIVNNFGITLENFKTQNNEEINDLIKMNADRLDSDIKENNNSIKDLKMKIVKINQIQSQLLKNNNSMRNLLNKNLNNKNNNINNINNEEIITNNRRNSVVILNQNNNNNILNEEEKQSKFRNFDFGNKTLESFKYHTTEYNTDKEKNNIKNINNYQNNNNKNSSNSSLTKIDKYKSKNNNIYSEENNNNNSISEYKNKLDISRDKNNLSCYKNISIEKDINESPFHHTKTMTASNFTKNKIIENKNKKRSNILKKEPYRNSVNINESLANLKMQKYITNNSSSQNNHSNIQVFGMSNQKAIIPSIETENNNDVNSKLIEIINENPSFKDSTGNNKFVRKRRYSLHKLANINFDEKANEVLPNMNVFSKKNIIYKNKKPNTPVIKNVFDQNYQLNLKNDKIKQNLTIDTPVKITSSFGRTNYAFYDKKEEGINNLINKGIKNKINKLKRNSFDMDFELSPVSKIKVYGNL